MNLPTGGRPVGSNHVEIVRTTKELLGAASSLGDGSSVDVDQGRHDIGDVTGLRLILGENEPWHDAKPILPAGEQDNPDKVVIGLAQELGERSAECKHLIHCGLPSLSWNAAVGVIVAPAGNFSKSPTRAIRTTCQQGAKLPSFRRLCVERCPGGSREGGNQNPDPLSRIGLLVVVEQVGEDGRIGRVYAKLSVGGRIGA